MVVLLSVIFCQTTHTLSFLKKKGGYSSWFMTRILKCLNLRLLFLCYNTLNNCQSTAPFSLMYQQHTKQTGKDVEGSYKYTNLFSWDKLSTFCVFVRCFQQMAT